MTIRPRSMSSAFKSWSINTRCSALRWTQKRKLEHERNAQEASAAMAARKSKRFGADAARPSFEGHAQVLPGGIDGHEQRVQVVRGRQLRVQSDAGDESAPAESKKPASPSPKKTPASPKTAASDAAASAAAAGGAKRG